MDGPQDPIPQSTVVCLLHVEEDSNGMLIPLKCCYNISGEFNKGICGRSALAETILKFRYHALGFKEVHEPNVYNFLQKFSYTAC